MKARIYVKGMGDKRYSIKRCLLEEDSHFYGKPCGYKEIMTGAGILRCGYQETDEGFRWLRSSGTYIEFLDSGDIYVSGARHSIDEFLNQFFSKAELEGAEIKKIESREPSRSVGDTL